MNLNDDLENIIILNQHNILFAAKEGFIHYNPLKEKRKIGLSDKQLVVFVDGNETAR